MSEEGGDLPNTKTHSRGLSHRGRSSSCGKGPDVHVYLQDCLPFSQAGGEFQHVLAQYLYNKASNRQEEGFKEEIRKNLSRVSKQLWEHLLLDPYSGRWRSWIRGTVCAYDWRELCGPCSPPARGGVQQDHWSDVRKSNIKRRQKKLAGESVAPPPKKPRVEIQRPRWVAELFPVQSIQSGFQSGYGRGRGKFRNNRRGEKDGMRGCSSGHSVGLPLSCSRIDFQRNQCRPHPVIGLKLFSETCFCYLNQ